MTASPEAYRAFRATQGARERRQVPVQSVRLDESFLGKVNPEGARANDVGWRIDYFVVSERFIHHVKDSYILADVLGSDHCPVMIELDLE